jgi:hypothetical protein
MCESAARTASIARASAHRICRLAQLGLAGVHRLDLFRRAVPEHRFGALDGGERNACSIGDSNGGELVTFI